MRVALFILLVCAAADLLVCAILFAVVWAEHRRVRKEAATAGKPIASAAGQLGCLFAFAMLGLAGLYAAICFLW